MIAVPLLGGIFGLQKAKSWGGWQSSMGRTTMGLALGLIAWAGGMIIWNFYLFFLDVEVPYPSLADAIFILSWPLWFYGVINLSKATGAKFGLREKKGKLFLFIIPIVAILASYYLLFEIARGGEFVWDVSGLQLFFDLFYPIGDIVILTAVALVFMLSRRFLGGKYRVPVFIVLLGFLLNYTSDFIFSYTTTLETYFNGHFVDFLFTTTMFVLSVGVILLDPKLRNRHQEKISD